MSDFHCCGGNDDHPPIHTMDCTRPFKVMMLHPGNYSNGSVEGRLREVPWAFIVQAEKCVHDRNSRAEKNHSQTLERLNERGGLSPKEIWHIYHDKGWGRSSGVNHFEIDEAYCADWLEKTVKEWMTYFEAM